MTGPLHLLSFLFVMSMITAVLAIYANHYRTEKLVSRYIASAMVLTTLHMICVFSQFQGKKMEFITIIDFSDMRHRVVEFFLFILHAWISHNALTIPVVPPELNMKSNSNPLQLV